MVGSKVCGGRALRIAVGITAFVLLMAGDGNWLFNKDNNQKSAYNILMRKDL
jgi:hypothetical protein